MRITLTRAVNVPLTLARQGDVLTFNGEPLDLSAIAEGDLVAPGDCDCPWVVGPITRTLGLLQLTVIAPYRGGVLPGHLWHPAPLLILTDGPVPLPAWEVPDV